MNAYQRVMAALTGQPVDRVPVLVVLGAYGGKLTHTDLKTVYSDSSAWVAGQQAVQDTFGLDMVMTPFDYSAIAEAFGGEVAWSEQQAPNMKRPAVGTAAEALQLPLPDPRQTGRLPVILEATKMLASLYKERVPVIGVLPGPGALPSLVTGLEAWMETLLFDRQAADKLLDYTGQFFVSWANALLQAGADCLVITEGMAALEVLPRTHFNDLIMPCLRSTFSQVQGPKVFHHNGGRINHIVDLLSSLEGLVAVSVSSKDDLSEARMKLGPDLALIGNLDCLAFPSASPEELYRQCMACLRSAAPAGPYLLANAGADIPLTATEEQIRVLKQASCDYAVETGAVS